MPLINSKIFELEFEELRWKMLYWRFQKKFVQDVVSNEKEFFIKMISQILTAKKKCFKF